MTPRFFMHFCARSWAVVSFGFGVRLWGAAQPVLPEAYPAERYEQLIEHSPFAVGTVQEPAAAPDAPGFAANLYVEGVAQLGYSEGKERDFVAIKSRADQSTFWLSTGAAPNRDGIELGAVEWSQGVGKSKVTIRKGTETAVLEFDEATLRAAPIAAGGGAEGVPRSVRPSPQPPGQPVPEAMLEMMKRSSQQPPRPGVPIQSPGARVVSPALPGAPQPAANPGEVRRRIRVISSKP
jgi:hypothetical protein